MGNRTFATLALLVWASIFSQSQIPQPSATSARGTRGVAQTPNILFIIMDDVGIDQLKIFGYGGATPAATPNINTIARAGVRFRNTWAMPECSPSRVMFFEGRYPLRTNIYGAILSDDLANSQLSPYEVTTPYLLKTVGYSSALFGKFHLGGPDYNPFGETTPHAAGFDYFDGFLEGAPYPVDTTIGGQFSNGSLYTCGFIPNTTDSQYGADFGACQLADQSCTEISRDEHHPTPGRTCLELGGVFVPNLGCQDKRPLNFFHTNAYYVWKRLINYPDGSYKQFSLNDPSARTYVSEVTSQSAIDWINQQNKAKHPWMATVSYANIHSPYQQPPTNLLPAFEPEGSGLQCTGNSKANEPDLRILSNQMLEAMDKEIGRVMVETGLATYKKDGSIDYNPEATNTMVVIIGDNGTYAPGVKAPFDPNHAKAWVFQTGVWVPLIVAGPLVVAPGRQVNAMINIADLFQLWGEIVGIDVHQAVNGRTIDSVSMLPYLTNPHQPPIRDVNFTQTQSNIHYLDEDPPPCVVQLSDPPTCAQLFTSQQLCMFEGGIWYGPGGKQQFSDCCAVKNSGLYDKLALLPDTQMTTRDRNYKLIQFTYASCVGQGNPYNEFYRIDEKRVAPQIDKLSDALCANPNDPTDQKGDFQGKQVCPGGLSAQETATYNHLLNAMTSIVASQPPCPGDGNGDLRVNQADLYNWQYFANINNGQISSWYDFNHDAVTDTTDEDVILQNLGKNCNQQSQSSKPGDAH